MGDDIDELGGSQLLDIMPGKREVTLLLLEKGTVYVHLDARRPGVELPSWLKGDGHVVLQFGTSPTFPIRDFRLDDDRISAMLFFQGVPHECVIPWGSVFAIVSADHRGMAWPDDVPADISARPAGDGSTRARRQRTDTPSLDSTTERKGRKSGQPALRLEGNPTGTVRRDGKPTEPEIVRDVAPAKVEAQGGRGGGRTKRPLPPYLRVVK